MEFCNECGTKLERDIENSTDYAICSNCNKTVKKKLNEKAIDEWEKLFGEYLFGKYGYYGYVNTPKNLSKKILDYKLYSNLETILSDEGNSNKIIQEILGINSSVWISAFEETPIDIKNFSHNDTIMTLVKRTERILYRNQNNKITNEEIDLKYKIFMNMINNLKKEIIRWKLTRSKLLIPYSTFIQWTKCKNNKNPLEMDLTKITRLLNNHRYEIIFIKSNNIVAEHRKTKNCIFLNLIDSAKSNNWDISLDILRKLIMNLGKTTANKSKNVEGFEDWDQGAMTKYDWHSYDSRKSRHNALKHRLYVEGFEKTFGTIKGLQSLWSGSNHPNHDHLAEVEDDFLWLQTYPTRHQSSKNKLSSKYRELQKNNEQLKNKKPNLMFFVNVSE
jgi:hypothetical protein